MQYHNNLGKYLEEAFGVTEFWYQGRRTVKTVAGVWVTFDKE